MKTNKVYIDSQYIKDVLARRGMTKAELSRRIGKYDDYICKALSRAWSDMRTVENVSRALRVPVDRIIVLPDKPVDRPVYDKCAESRIKVDWDELYLELRKAGISVAKMSLMLNKCGNYLCVCKNRNMTLKKDDYDKIKDAIGSSMAVHEAKVEPADVSSFFKPDNADFLYNIIYKATTDAIKKMFE